MCGIEQVVERCTTKGAKSLSSRRGVAHYGGVLSSTRGREAHA
jgi:hypothetical protein